MVQVVVGRIGKAHGIRGEVTVEVRTDDPDQRFAVDAGGKETSAAAVTWNRVLSRVASLRRSTVFTMYWSPTFLRSTSESVRKSPPC